MFIEIFFIKPEVGWANYEQIEKLKKIKTQKIELVYVAKYWDDL